MSDRYFACMRMIEKHIFIIANHVGFSVRKRSMKIVDGLLVFVISCATKKVILVFVGSRHIQWVVGSMHFLSFNVVVR